jgi:hypothetical protein
VSKKILNPGFREISFRESLDLFVTDMLHHRLSKHRTQEETEVMTIEVTYSRPSEPREKRWGK